MRLGRWRFVGCYAASGAAALIYQVAWTRLFTLELGHTVASSSTVLAAFMGGLAVGAWLTGRFPPAPAHRLQTYAVLEIVVALLAIALPAALLALRPALAWAYADGSEPLRFALVRVTLSLVLLGLPAGVMGATFPIAAAWLADAGRRKSRPQARPAAEVAVVYAANTAGAAVGAIAAGFWLIPAVGLRATTWIGVGLNVAAACGAIWIAHEQAAPGSRPAPDIGRENAEPAKKSRGRVGRTASPAAAPLPRLACVAAALSGFSALVYEVAWTRLLALVIGPTTYAFATMAAAFISGIALGSAAGARLAGRVANPAYWLAGTLLTTAISASAAAWFAASRLPLLFADKVAGSTSFESVLLLEVLSVVLLLLPTGISLGASFTLAVATASSGAADIGRVTARVYAANTLGAVGGALAAGFLLVPGFGLQATVVGMSRVSAIGGVLVAAALLARRSITGRSRGFVAIASAGCVLSIALADVSAWDRDLLASGAYKYAGNMDADELEARLRAGTLEYYREGAAATVSVRLSGGTRSLAVDGKVDASNAADMLTQRMLGVLPILMHPRPENLLVIGLGSGVTASSALASGEVRRADVVEISPEVVEASALFAGENGDALRAPGVRLILGDGRSHLLLTTQLYDVIVSEPSNPWMAGVAALFTREFFEAARARLRPGGLLCQWAHTYEMSGSDLRSIAATFASVFPQGSMWLVGEGDLLLVGTAGGDIESRLAGIEERSNVGKIPVVLADVGMTSPAAPFVLLSQYAGGPAQLASYSEGAVLQIDDRMALEFTAARAMYTRAPNDNVRAIRALTADGQLPRFVSSVLSAADARSWSARGATEMQAAGYSMAYESFRRAVALDSRDTASLRGASEAAARVRRLPDARKWLEALAAGDPANAAVRVELAHVLAAGGDADGAVAMAREAGRLEPDNPLPLEQLASIFEDLGDGNQLGRVAERLGARFPDRDSSRYYHAATLYLQGRASGAADAARLLLATNPRHAKAQNLLGVACAADGRLECARSAFEAAIVLSPRDPSPYVNLGVFHLQTANPRAAAGYFAEALVLDSASATAREGLAQARSARSAR